ncbi:TetR/AcrR family transcriptional regulator [Heyndrickxia sp. FSL K6-6286]|jgi:DNA-binding transcriptional regulator YbjK|uniref:TetR/AcrR family transcriptional regulator n=1 Tax=Heyndrickxia sp. FSL K6-6286 TaxID=2921510 RepID=UPI0003A982C6|nr:TetR/AcrR family transcriptional regulator [Heyndrickxia oleronia]OJH16816.1 TetR family transcriptional regulator [Bacillus obstructivus]
MPKIVDHEQRRTQIAEATWRVILDNGMEGATVRNIAKEAGLSLGALRHYFSTQNELLIYAMNLVKERVTERINKLVMSDLPPKEKVVSILMEIVPVNTETIAEMEVWLAFTFHSKNKVDIFDHVNDRIFQGIQKLMALLEMNQLLKKNVNKDIEAERLYAIVDGLAFHAMQEPQRVTKEWIHNVFTYHLDSICIDDE